MSVCPSIIFISFPSVFISFLDDNFSKHKWIFTKLGKCNDITEIWFGIADDQICQILTELFVKDTPICLFLDNNLSKC